MLEWTLSVYVMLFDFSKLAKIFNFGGLTSDEGGVVGVDIGSSSIKVVQLKRVGGGAVLETYGELQLGPYANVEIGRATNLDPARLSEALVDIVREASVSSKKIALGISYSASFLAVITLPVADEAQLASMVPIEARKYVPVPINEVTIDWFVIPDTRGETGAAKGTTLRILLAAIHNEALGKYRTVAKNAALSAGFTEIEVFSTIRSSVLEEDGIVVLLDLGAATTKLYVVDGGIVQRTHSITAGSQDMTLALSQALQLSVADAEELKRQVGLSEAGNDPRIKQSLNFTLERILAESRRVVGAYEIATKVKVSKVILTGGGALLKGLLATAKTYFERDVVLADPFSKVEYPAFLEDTLKEAGPSFAVAIGVALRRLNEE
ncbi:type IV pilus assembly protein PilM [Candidatus Kaiserbacteria bacterium]|nr:type IV pilus assembly protein PilM [Candidatus Kaiserbacteria bacterium]